MYFGDMGIDLSFFSSRHFSLQKRVHSSKNQSPQLGTQSNPRGHSVSLPTISLTQFRVKSNSGPAFGLWNEASLWVHNF
jgi:hypothetical protein